jgi:hypothetical protein
VMDKTIVTKDVYRMVFKDSAGTQVLESAGLQVNGTRVYFHVSAGLCIGPPEPMVPFRMVGVDETMAVKDVMDALKPHCKKVTGAMLGYYELDGKTTCIRDGTAFGLMIPNEGVKLPLVVKLPSGEEGRVVVRDRMAKRMAKTNPAVAVLVDTIKHKPAATKNASKPQQAPAPPKKARVEPTGEHGSSTGPRVGRVVLGDSAEKGPLGQTNKRDVSFIMDVDDDSIDDDEDVYDEATMLNGYSYGEFYPPATAIQIASLD